MLRLGVENQLINGCISSDLSHVELVSHLIQDILSYDRVHDTTKPVLVTRELLKNAVVHGNKENPELDVSFMIERLANQRFKITVKDAGEGFNYRQYKTRIPLDPRQDHRMGYAIISNFSDSIEFDDNGSSVSVMIRLDETGGGGKI
jgi:anti-sigma regulatory factor (Ser/Thr protein kinase)